MTVLDGFANTPKATTLPHQGLMLFHTAVLSRAAQEPYMRRRFEYSSGSDSESESDSGAGTRSIGTALEKVKLWSRK